MNLQSQNFSSKTSGLKMEGSRRSEQRYSLGLAVFTASARFEGTKEKILLIGFSGLQMVLNLPTTLSPEVHSRNREGVWYLTCCYLMRTILCGLDKAPRICLHSVPPTPINSNHARFQPSLECSCDIGLQISWPLTMADIKHRASLWPSKSCGTTPPMIRPTDFCSPIK